MSAHIEGQKVGTHAYKAHGCRCDGCTAAATAYMRKSRSRRGKALQRVETRQQRLALAWMRKHHPDVMREMRSRAYEELGIDRRKPGRPPGTRTEEKP